MTVYTSPLFEIVQNYVEKSGLQKKKLFIFAPYIRTHTLSKLLKNVNVRTVIITSWRTNDLLSGASELSLYPYCKANGITLYINNRIHLKAYSADLEDMLITTLNISERGLEDISEANYECATILQDLNNDARLYLAKIQREARLVNEPLYQSLLKWYLVQKTPASLSDSFDEIVPPRKFDHFLISALPMTSKIDIMEECYQRFNEGLVPSTDSEIRDCFFHDLANYAIPQGLSISEFRRQLAESFFNHPFIKKIDQFIAPEAYFGRIKEWIQNNCTDVPVPSRRELTGNVQVLLEWFVKLGNGRYIVDIPYSYSQRIRRIDG